MSESTPLLLSQDPSQSGTQFDVYNRFSSAKKKVILFTIAWAGLVTQTASGSFIPNIPEVAKDLKTTGTIVNYTVGLYVIVVALGGIFWAPYSGYYGRQPIYLITVPLMCLGSFSVALVSNVPQLIFWRTVQALGASSVSSVGAATVADIYRLEERGTAMGIYIGTVLLGFALAPIIGGIIATYASWRITQLVVFLMSAFGFILIIFVLPETSHPGSRGVDKELADHPTDSEPSRRKRTLFPITVLNPFKAFRLFSGPPICFAAIIMMLNLITDYGILVPFSYTVGSAYGLNSPALIGISLFPMGLGNVLGAPLAGYLSDLAIISRRKSRGGTWVPEDRLLAAVPGMAILVPLSTLIIGLMVQFVPGKVGLIVCLVCLFVNGIGVDTVMGPCNTYAVDILLSRSAEVIAINTAFRSIFSGLVAAGVLPSINTIGVAATYGVLALGAWIGFILLAILIRYGKELREWKDVGYTLNQGGQR